MTKQVQRRRGTATQHTSFTGAEGEVSVNTTNKSVHVHDGVTAGGIEGARADLTNVSDSDLNARLTGNTLSSLTITSADINGGTIDGTVIGGTTPAAGNFTNISATGTVDGRDVAADGTKLDGIEAGADVTDTTSVTAAGALMDSELANITAVKALDQGVATTDDPTFTNTQLAAIAASKGVTAVDVFVYDTSKDSDGGAWRKRTQGTSWYNEALNTATRGSRREFPAVAVIVAEATKVTIYDGDDSALPMWMVFIGSTGNMLYGGSIVSVFAINGALCSGSTSYAVNLISFLDDAHKQYATGGNRLYLGNIEQRNDNLGVGSYSAGSIVNNTVNDCAMTVLPDAPIDPATGLPVPTIAVATAGGISQIGWDGVGTNNVWDFGKDGGGDSFSYVDFTKDFKLITSGGPNSTYTAIRVNSLLTADTYYTHVSYKSPSLEHYYYGSVPNFKAAPVGGASSAFNPSSVKPAEVNTSYAGFNNKLSALHSNPTTQTSGMVAYTTSTYNTGWMNGNIKGAFLSDTDDTDLVGAELVTNGTFDTDISGWTEDSVTTSVSSGVVTVTNNGDSNKTLFQTITTVIGRTYVIQGVGINGTGSARIYATGLAGYFTSGPATFVATSTSTKISLLVFGADGTSASFDNISVKLADADRSVNNNGLIINGTVTRSPVSSGADLVAYSGFSSSNYLEAPYNSDLDFGTGDFCVMGWVKVNTPVIGSQTIIDRDGDGPRLRVAVIGSALRFFDVNSFDTGNITSDVWTFFSIVRENNQLTTYINGSDVGSASSTTDFTSTSNKLTVGIDNDETDPLAGSLSILRISATAPSAEQIAKIYNDEKVLFQENAQATLYGSSDAVTALSHDSDTQMLHVGTSAGRSVFQGLRRVSNTTTAVGTAISASNGLVVEE